MIYRLGTIEIDPANFLLTADGEAVPVEPLVFDLIVCLVENRDRVLTRQELFDMLWAGRIVSDTSLSNHIKSARKALGDDGQQQRVIKTVHGRGYRFVADVDGVADRQGAQKDARPVGWWGGRAPRMRWAMYAVVLLFVVAVASLILIPGPDQTVESIAVLPLKNLSDDPEQQYFVEGMQDALIARLSRTTELRLISRTSTVRFGTTDMSIPEIARELNVDALVEGSVLRDDDRVRITAQLVLGRTDEHLWAASYDRDLDHVLPLINEISMAIAGEIEVAVKPEPGETSTDIRSVDVRVHELYLKGRHSFDEFRFDESLSYFQQAVELDPEFAPAHAAIAGCQVVKEIFNLAPDTDLIPMAREAALQALALDSNSAGGHSSLGAIQLYFDWDWGSAGRNLARALELSPNDGITRHAYADYLMVMGDLEGSLEQVEIGLLYDPYSPMANSVVDFHRLLVRDYDAVIESGRKAIAADPNSVLDYSFYREALWLSGLREEGLEAYKETWGRDEDLLRAMETGYLESGYAGAVRSLADALAGRVPEYRDYIKIAALYTRAGEQEPALSWLEKAYDHRQPQILHIKAMPVFAELHSHPGFENLLDRIGFPDNAAR